MLDTNTDTTEDQFAVEQWLQRRKDAGTRIDPETAEVWWTYALTMDPYGVYPDLPEEYKQIGREEFARAPGSDIWVWFGDLPVEVQKQLRKAHGSSVAFTLRGAGK